MLLDFSVDWQWVVGGTDVSPFVETWELAREQPDMGTPAWWRGKLVLRPVVGRDLNLDPLTNSLWQQGTDCSLTVAGYLVFTGSVLLAYYDDWSTAPRLELEVGDVLAAKNHRQVIPFGEYNAQSLLATLGIPGVAPAGDKVELSTDLTSPVKVLQELIWVTGLKAGIPVTLFTRPDGQVDYVSPQNAISLTRTLEQVADFTRQRPALEIPGSVIASASLTYSVQLPPPGDEGGSQDTSIIVSKEGDVVKVTYVDTIGRPVREETIRGMNLDGWAVYQYSFGNNWYETTKEVFVRGQTEGYYYSFERTIERGERVLEQFLAGFIRGQVVAQKKTAVFWPRSRFFPVNDYTAGHLAYLVEEYQLESATFTVPGLFYGASTSAPYLVRLTTRAKGTTQDVDTFSEAVTLAPTTSEIIPNQEIRFPAWAQMPRPDEPPKLERVTDTLSEEVTVVGFTGPPVYLNIPWLSVTVDEPVGSPDLEQRIEDPRQSIRRALQAAATWMAIEIAGRAFARRIKMPVPSEWLGDPRPWTLARVGNEVFWLVGETLRGTSQGVEFEATGILAGRPNMIPPDAFPPGMFPPGTIPPDTSSPGLFSPGTIPSFIPLVTVRSTRFPKVGIGCEMGVSEMVAIPGDPWLGMAVEIEYFVSAPVDTSAMVGISVGELTEAWLGLAADAAYEVEGGEDDEDDSGSVTEGLTLEAEDGVINGGVIVYDTDASSCYAVEAEDDVYNVYFSVDSTSLAWDRPLRLRVVYKATGEGEFLVYLIQGPASNFLRDWTVNETTGYVGLEIIIPEEEEPFDGIYIDVAEYPGKVRIDAIQIIPATGDWPPLNPCSE